MIYCYVTELHASDCVIKDFVVKKKGALFVPDPVYEFIKSNLC